MRNINRNDFVVVIKSLGCVRFFATPWTRAHQAPLSMGLPRLEYWEVSSVSCIESRLFTHWATGEANKNTGMGFHLLLQGMFPTQGRSKGYKKINNQFFLPEVQ